MREYLNEIEAQEVIHGWLECYVDALRVANPCGDQLMLSVANEIERDLQAHLDVFQPEMVGVKRIRESITQGSVELSYNGALIERFGDDIRIVPKDASPHEYGEECGGFAGLPDWRWIAAAKRFFYEGRRDGHRLYPPLKTRDAQGLMTAFESAVEKVGRLRAPIFDRKSWVQDINRTHARAIAAGYMSGLPFRVVGNQVSALSGQIYGEIYWAERREDRRRAHHVF